MGVDDEVTGVLSPFIFQIPPSCPRLDLTNLHVSCRDAVFQRVSVRLINSLSPLEAILYLTKHV